MGYREIDGNWAKPVGYHLFTYKPSTKKWANWFEGSKNPLCWNSATFEDSGEEDSFLNFLKQCECETRISTLKKSNFHFLTRVQQIESII